ncbi:putative glycoside hydrolase, family 79, major facilitator, sugar transporter [Rosa chinensis]|uniref:Putative glycoside hydrolase, family 79, major facilitator, sugar transporter n=1 Tax=Rosa chinensis TaxID=74649 RepID=A0A2P6QEJ4_ROSCH|nr:putative glycoside hydrolase, family 79, major facilitator, sugar transporter [Rosa chinensis]
MGSSAIACCILLSLFSVALAEYVDVRVRGVVSIASTDDNFICATLDWWPTDKCDYNQCPWGKAGIFNLDLKNKTLINAVKAFNTIRIRIGRSLQDQIIYNFGYGVKDCNQIVKDGSGPFLFRGGCPQPKRWDEIHEFFNQTQAKLLFGLNALHGKQADLKDKILWVGDWDAKNARDLMEYTISKGYPAESYELGNELCGSGVGARIEAEQYAKDMKKLKQLVTELFPDGKQPKVLGPGGSEPLYSFLVVLITLFKLHSFQGAALVAFAATIGNFLQGWDNATIAGAIVYITDDFDLGSSVEGLVVAMSLIGATVITTCSGAISDWLSRRPMLIASSVLYFVSGLVMLWSPNVYVLCLARLLDGFGIGLAVTLVPVYISETAPSDIRGSLNTLPQFLGSGGMFLSYCMVFGMSL